MAIFKCKMCGGTIEFEQGATVGVCDSCGTKQTLPRLDDDRRANLYDRANHFRRNNEFDKATSIYEQILTEDTADAEAYWSLVLCKYGIEYVEDPATRKRVPTVNRAQFTSVFDDDNYKSALQYADVHQRELYEKEAKIINDIQKGILAISQKEEPFDVFICYKETDRNGRRTPDSVLANDLYHQLTQEGFKVFFARITLEDKLGTAYEPYIFAALNSAKVMVVLGTKPEFFNAVWVKNEWSRYLSLVKQSGGKKVLIPAYRDMDPYDLPDEFSHLQAQDMSKLGFMQDLIRGIKKIVSKDAPKNVGQEVTAANGSLSVQPLLERAFIFLEDGNWGEADAYCEKVLDQDPKNAQAYLGKLMADVHAFKKEDLSNCEKPFDGNNNYQKALRFGDEKLSYELSGYIKHINERNENNRLTCVYETAVSAMSAAKSEAAFKTIANSFKEISGFRDSELLAEQCPEKAEVCRKNEIYSAAKAQMAGKILTNYKNAIESLRKIPGWRDADELLASCQKTIEEINAKAEAERLENERQAEQNRLAMEKSAKKRKKIAAIVIPAIALCIIVLLLFTLIIPSIKLSHGEKLFEEQKYEEAKEIFLSLRGFSNSEDWVEACELWIEEDNQYNYAISLMDDGVYSYAIDIFNALDGYKDSALQIIKCEQKIQENKYKHAVSLMKEGNYSLAITEFKALDGYSDSKVQITRCEAAIKDETYNKAIRMMNDGDYSEAIVSFKSLDGYKDSLEQIKKCENAIMDAEYNNAIALMNNGNYAVAIIHFKSLYGYKDSDEQIRKCEYALDDNQYKKAIDLMNSKQYVEAYETFVKLSGFKDSDEKALQIRDKYIEEKLRKSKAGDYVIFGTYEQDNNESNGKENIEWLVLKKDGDQVLLLSHYSLDCQPFSENRYTTYNGWKDCSLRTWLNETFANRAFTAAERNKIQNTTLTTDSINNSKMHYTLETTDKVFLLSYQEQNEYLISADTKTCYPTKYAEAQKASTRWWLRSDYLYQSAEVVPKGRVNPFGTEYTRESSAYDSLRAVRPAMWVKIGD